MDSIEKYALFSGHSYDKNDQGAAHSANVTMITGTAMSDSTDGVVSVDFGGNTISADDEQAVDVSTTCAVKEGDTVQVSVVGADGTAKSLLVTGVIAGGDRIAKEVDGASTAASEAKQSASDAQNAADTAQNAADTAKANAAAAQSTADKAVTNAAAAQSTADTANSTANTTKTYFYNDGSGSHVVSKNSTSAGTRADVKTDGMHIVDQDDGKELASFTSNGAVIGKTNTIHSRTTSTGIQFEDGKKSWAYASIDALTSDPELCDDGNTFSGTYYDSSPDDVATNDGYYHSLSRMYQGSKKGTSSDTPSYAFTGISSVTENASAGVTKTASVSVHTANAANTRSNHPETSFASIDADATYINGLKLPIIVQGSKVLRGLSNATSAPLFTKDELVSMLVGVSSINTDLLTICVSNGDSNVNSIHIESAAFAYTWNTIYVVFAGKASGAVRVNYLIAYNG